MRHGFKDLTGRNGLTACASFGNVLFRKMIPDTFPLQVAQPNQSTFIPFVAGQVKTQVVAAAGVSDNMTPPTSAKGKSPDQSIRKVRLREPQKFERLRLREVLCRIAGICVTLFLAEIEPSHFSCLG